MHATLEPHLLFPDLALWHHPDMHYVLQYLAWAGIEMEYQDAFWTSKKVRDMIKDHFTVVVKRRNVFSDKLYKDDDTIFGWDTYNVRCSLLLLTCLRSCGTDSHACDGMMLACMQCVGVHATDVQLMGPCGKGSTGMPCVAGASLSSITVWNRLPCCSHSILWRPFCLHKDCGCQSSGESSS